MYINIFKLWLHRFVSSQRSMQQNCASPSNRKRRDYFKNLLCSFRLYL